MINDLAFDGADLELFYINTADKDTAWESENANPARHDLRHVHDDSPHLCRVDEYAMNTALELFNDFHE